MRIGNLSGRLTLFTDAGAVDVEHASNSRFAANPESIYPRWAEFTQWARTCPWDSAVDFLAHHRQSLPKSSQSALTTVTTSPRVASKHRTIQWFSPNSFRRSLAQSGLSP
jgi:hypothetical protein